jgi:hypothetical protein
VTGNQRGSRGKSALAVFAIVCIKSHRNSSQDSILVKRWGNCLLLQNISDKAIKIY